MKEPTECEGSGEGKLVITATKKVLEKLENDGPPSAHEEGSATFIERARPGSLHLRPGREDGPMNTDQNAQHIDGLKLGKSIGHYEPQASNTEPSPPKGTVRVPNKGTFEEHPAPPNLQMAQEIMKASTAGILDASKHFVVLFKEDNQSINKGLS
ncbi:hypothetical protein PVK06_038130 [Gossypium arboreum]|uniref:Uncharacterized protein n=1 Tax=Gossypium arboreum TaxID=29729 RepID=A0ABR0MZB3_GOSAR|nr:hypothetical protein PVK06_038130 [Gossypium arboreum]